jgi:hypothetical protein
MMFYNVIRNLYTGAFLPEQGNLSDRSRLFSLPALPEHLFYTSMYGTLHIRRIVRGASSRRASFTMVSDWLASRDSAALLFPDWLIIINRREARTDWLVQLLRQDQVNVKQVDAGTMNDLARLQLSVTRNGHCAVVS